MLEQGLAFLRGWGWSALARSLQHHCTAWSHQTVWSHPQVGPSHVITFLMLRLHVIVQMWVLVTLPYAVWKTMILLSERKLSLASETALSVRSSLL